MTVAFLSAIRDRPANTGVVERPWGAIITRRGRRGYDIPAYGIRRDGSIIRDRSI